MQANQSNIGFGDDRLEEGSAFRMGRGAFVPLADVPDYVWIPAARNNPARRNEPRQHFADIDIPAIDGGPSLLQACRKNPRKLAPDVWRDYFAGFGAAGCGPEEGCLPFRVWQLWNEMVDALGQKDVKTFVAAAGVMAHYVGDASQPLHCSYLHHGRLPMLDRPNGKYPVAHSSAEYAAFAKTREAKIHGIYEETMLEVAPADALADVNDALKGKTVSSAIKNGWEAARATFGLMSTAHESLSPDTIIDADDPSLGPKERARRLWANPTVREATVASLAASTLVLARIWAGAWRVGGGDQIAEAKLRAFSEDQIAAVYRSPQFARPLTLDEMAGRAEFQLPT
jgi:hypothetical protein